MLVLYFCFQSVIVSVGCYPSKTLRIMKPLALACGSGGRLAGSMHLQQMSKGIHIFLFHL